MEEKVNVKKVFILLVPAWGHVNPITGIVRELTNKNVQVVFYASSQYKALIENTGATYREYSYFPSFLVNSKTIKDSRNSLLDLCSDLLDFTDHIVPELIADVEKEKPDLIIYDSLSFHALILLEILQVQYAKDNSKLKPPHAIKSSPSFARKQGVYPNADEMKTFHSPRTFWYPFELASLVMRQTKFSLKYGLSIFNPASYFYSNDSQNKHTVITTVFPEFQPRREQFDDRFKFVGSCVNEQVRKDALDADTELDKVLSLFEPINPIESVELKPKSNCKLIFVSLGTVFNNNIFVFDAIIEALQKLEFDMKSSELRVVIAMGQKIYQQFQSRMSAENYKLSENFVLRPFVAQIEVLKRASLFITHCGMNSASEAVHYAVPVVCIPIAVDQPMVARRMTDELNLGKRFDPLHLDVDKLSSAINEVLSDQTYLKRSIEMSKSSRKYDGNKNGCVEILNILNNL